VITSAAQHSRRRNYPAIFLTKKRFDFIYQNREFFDRIGNVVGKRALFDDIYGRRVPFRDDLLFGWDAMGKG
jgi:hypothetical protein